MRNISNAFTKFSIIIFVGILQGCAGFGYYMESGYTRSIDKPSISKNFAKVSNEANNVPINGYTLKIYWGLPYRINNLGNNTFEWIYGRSWSHEPIEHEWRGLFIIIGIIPVPIGLPIGNEEVRVILENGFVKKAYVEDSHESALAFLLFMSGPDGPGFFLPVALDRDKKNHLEEYKDCLITQAIEEESLLICKSCGQPYFKKDINTKTCNICGGPLVSLDEFYFANPLYNSVVEKMRYEVELKDKSAKMYFYRPFP